MNYYLLTDAFRKGVVISEDGRKHFRFVFGRFAWERTTIFQPYLTEGAREFGHFEVLSPEDAMATLSQYGKDLNKLREKAYQYATDSLSGLIDRNGTPCIEHTTAVAEELDDWDESIVALLYGACSMTADGVAELHAMGFPSYICAATELLRRNEQDSYEEYLKKVRKNRIARNVKLLELSYQMTMLEQVSTDPRILQTYRLARQLLHGDLQKLEGEAEESLVRPADRQFVPTETILESVYAKALGGRKVPHGISSPVLRSVDGKLALAFFVYTYSQEDLQAGTLGRPLTWIVTDLVNGNILREISCAAEDFSAEPVEGRYSMEQPKGGKDQTFFSRAYGLLDALRRECIETGRLSKGAYENYLHTLLEAIPSAYHCFYRELSL